MTHLNQVTLGWCRVFSVNITHAVLSVSLTGTYVTSSLILLMWKEEAPLLSPDLLNAAVRVKYKSRNNLVFFFHSAVIEQLTKSNFIPNLQLSHIYIFWLEVLLQRLLADISNRMSGVVLCVSSCRHLCYPPGLSALYCMSKSAEDCMEHAEEARNAPLFDVSVYICRHEASRRLVV